MLNNMAVYIDLWRLDSQYANEDGSIVSQGPAFRGQAIGSQ